MRAPFGSSSPSKSSGMEAGDATSSKSTPSSAGTPGRNTPSSSLTARRRLMTPSGDARPTTFGRHERGDTAAASSAGPWRLPRVRAEASSSPPRATEAHPTTSSFLERGDTAAASSAGHGGFPKFKQKRGCIGGSSASILPATFVPAADPGAGKAHVQSRDQPKLQ